MNVKERIQYLAYLEPCLDSKNLIFRYIKGRNPYSKIKAEYLIEATMEKKTFLFSSHKEIIIIIIIDSSHFLRKKANISQKKHIGFIRLSIIAIQELSMYSMTGFGLLIYA